MITSTNVGELAAAMAAAQMTMENPKFDAQNPHFRSKFASLAAVRDSVIPVMASHGISVSQELAAAADGVSCTTILMHSSGQWASYGPLVIPYNKDDAQGRGSAATYARRYALQSVAGVVGESDDDAEAAQGRNKPTIAADSGDTLSPKQQKFAAEFAASIVAALHADEDQAVITAKIAQLNSELSEDKLVGLAAWNLLNSKDRAAFKAYVKQDQAA